ncbi:MAG: hypothetical protein OXF68_01445 [Gammaproteobacteria bacterium]|nr:hypothetical protein [Gammaproteobacteria bacterium]
MPKSIRDQIRKEAIRIIADHLNGIRFPDLQRQIHEARNSFKMNTIADSIYNLHDLISEVEKPARGVFQIKGVDTDGSSGAE